MLATWFEFFDSNPVYMGRFRMTLGSAACLFLILSGLRSWQSAAANTAGPLKRRELALSKPQHAFRQPRARTSVCKTDS